MTLVKFILGDPPYESGDVAELPEAEAEAKQYDGIVEVINGSVEENDNAPVEWEGWNDTPADAEAEGIE